MAIKLIANYSKRLGLPGYSSHQFSVSVETELVAIDDVPQEAGRIYRLLQHNVDEQIQATGFVPAPDYGLGDAPPSPDGGDGTGGAGGPNGHGPAAGHWRCSDKQKELILKLVDEHSLDRQEVDHLARQRFGKGVRQLNKMEASGLIDGLLESHGANHAARSNGARPKAFARNGGGR